MTITEGRIEMSEATRWWNTEWPLTRSLDLGEEGLAMKATRSIDRLHCDYCLAELPAARAGRGGTQPHRRFCSTQCRNRSRNAARRNPSVVACAVCGEPRTLSHPGLAGDKCRNCAVKVATSVAVIVNTKLPRERFNKFVRHLDNGCWEWTGTRQRNGYGAFGVGGKTLRAHRWAYEEFVAPIPEGLTIDHLCRNRACVNPDHVEPVTSAENTRRVSAVQR